ncbi:conserved hypothetical protein [Treponema primitia ZAS-2]|uniref:Thioredoxin n=1 Tax=Treponema primitia (strain ATCC BAA-887 / DSM 12427 / ZAS-2) TaxID=545694 RepID=F5YJ60_TREPZ|nr:aryl-sulfate sulfotransferase [Treponema primitia]AEF86693.1 conserved hypothetical protein [Treponema primitia ZAS-2]
MGHPTIYPTGVTVYSKDAAWNGYTVFTAPQGVLLIDQNGREVRLWKGLFGEPARILPGGFALGSTGKRSAQASASDNLDLVQVDWNGNIVWSFNHNEYVEDPGQVPRWIARQHHDYQREGSSVGYYAPGSEPRTDGGNTLILVNRNVYNPAVSGKTLLDNRIIEVNWEGKILWEWNAADHFEEFGFSEAAKNAIYRLPSEKTIEGGQGDWIHINAISTLGPNKWYDGGDQRFHPDNIIFDGRNVNILGIISRKTGKIVWKLGPDFDHTHLGQIIGQHHFHLIPKGLPGEGNFLVFDNGGWAGYGVPSGVAPYGAATERRDYSRILEFNPQTLEVEWQYTPAEAGFIIPLDAYKLYSPYISSAQRLPNGNTLITEGSNGRIFEITRDYKTAWEYINPYSRLQGRLQGNLVYRAYRVPYEWVPQLDHPVETDVAPLNISTFRVPGAAAGPGGKVTKIDGIDPQATKVLEDPYGATISGSSDEASNFCVVNSGSKNRESNS